MTLMCMLYAGYSRLTRPMLRSEVTRPVNRTVPAPPVPTGLKELTSGVLKWNGTPNYSVTRDSGRTKLVFDSWERIGDPELGVIELRPFAFVTEDPERPGDPFVMQSESARIRFDSFDLFKQKVGKILGGELFGRVDITGPDGLQLTGRSFVLDDRNLFSDWPVSFRFGPSSEPNDDRIRVAGQADGVVLEFHTAGPGESGLMGDDLPPITGMKSLWLRQNVSLDVLSDQSEPGRPKKPDHLVIVCDGNARYSVDERIAVFNRNVRVAHSQSAQGAGIDLPNVLHTLDGCDRLALSLADTGKASAPHFANFSLALAMQSIAAEGRQLLLTSIADNFVALGGRMTYDLMEHEAVLSGGAVTPNAPPPLVAVTIDGQELRCPMTRVQTTDDNRLVKASFPGPGVLRTTDTETGEGARIPSIQANWERMVVIEPVLSDVGEPQMRMKADGQVRIRLADEQTVVSAPNLTAWINERDRTTVRQLRVANTQRENPLKRILAENGAHIVRPDFDVEASHLFELNLVPLASVGDPIRQTSSSSADIADPTAASGDPPIVATAKAIGVTLGVAGSDVELLGLTAESNVRLEQLGKTRNDPPRMKVTTDRASLSGRGQSQRLTLTGGPSEIEADGLSISAVQLSADREKGTVEVPGGGKITIPMTGDLGRSLDGAGTPSKEPLSVSWSERLEFNGDTVSFFGDVIAKQGDAEARSDRLDVELSRPVDFANLTPDNVDQFRDEPLDLKVLTFRHNVVVSAKEWEGTELKSLRTASLATLSFDQTTQRLHGVGPGVIRQWTRETNQKAAANFATSLASYRLTRVAFVGEMTGHAERHWLRLSRSVRAMSGLVSRPLVDLTRDELLDDSTQPVDAFWLGCNTLEVLMDPTAAGEKIDVAKVEIQATGRVEIEGREFRAIADMANVDRTTGLMTIRGDGGNHASLWWQKAPGQSANAVRARAFRLNPDKRTFEVDEAAGFWGGR